jgi:signal transduction histidine kinase
MKAMNGRGRSNKQNIINLQWVVVLGTAYLLLSGKADWEKNSWTLLLIVVLFASNLLLYRLPASALDRPAFTYTLVLGDTVLVSLGIALSDQSPWDLFLIFFFGLFIVGIGETLTKMIAGCLLMSLIFAVYRTVRADAAEVVNSDLLYRLPFLVGNFILFAYVGERAKAEKSRSEKEKGILHDINCALTSSLDLQTVMNLLLEKIDQFLSYDVALTLRLFDKANAQLQAVACRNLDEREWKAEEWRDRGRGIPNLVAGSKEILMIEDVRKDPRAKNPEFFERQGMISYLGIPLTTKDELVGVLGIYSKEQRPFGADEINFLNLLAGYGAVAINNSRLYSEILRQAVELEQANRAKSEFLNVMSHELRTPLTVVAGYAGMLKAGFFGATGAEQDKALGQIIARTGDLTVLIDSILEATRIATGKIKITMEDLSLADFLENLKQAYKFPRAKEVALNWDYSSELPILKTDGGKLRQILQNLIDNALKFTEQGSVTLSVRHYAQARNIKFKVQDTGIGIPQESLPLIFEKFRQLDGSETRAYEGVGLGLYIVKKFAELLGGEIAVESEPGRGSVFTVLMPLS